MRHTRCSISLAVAVFLAASARGQDPQPLPLLPPQPIPVVTTAPVALRPMTVGEFVAGVQPAAGHYDVVLLHPHTQCPVRVCFTLPPGCPKKIRYRSSELQFDYGRREVEIHFRRNGRVSVDYD